MTEIDDWFLNMLTHEKGLSPQQFFFETLTAKIVNNRAINKATLQLMADAIASTHKLQSELGANSEYSFFDLLDDQYTKLIRPAYNAVIEDFQGGENQRLIVDLDDPTNRGLFKEFYPIFNRVVREIVKNKLKD